MFMYSSLPSIKVNADLVVLYVPGHLPESRPHSYLFLRHRKENSTGSSYLNYLQSEVTYPNMLGPRGIRITEMFG